MYAGLVGMVIWLLAEEPVSVLLVFQIEVNDWATVLALKNKNSRMGSRFLVISGWFGVVFAYRLDKMMETISYGLFLI